MAKSESISVRKTIEHLNNLEDKENIPLKNTKTLKSKSHFMSNNSKKFSIYEAKPKNQDKNVGDNIKTITNRNEKRPPLKDVEYKNLPVKDTIDKKVKTFTECKNSQERTQKWLRDCASQTDFSDDDFVECDFLKSKARDSYPLHVNKLHSKRNEESQTILNYKINTRNVTYKRDYDTSEINESAYDSLLNSSNNDPFFDITGNNNLEQMHDALSIPQKDYVKSTPLNSVEPPGFIDIKLARRCFLRNILNEKVTEQTQIVHKKLFTDNIYDDLKSQKLLGISPLVIPSAKQQRNNCIHKVTALGVVNLDIYEHYVDFNILYSPIYLESAVRHMMGREMSYIISPYFIKSGLLSDMNRSIVVNWLIKLQTYLKTEHISLYTAVRLFDKGIDSLQIPLQSLQLVALTSFWISLKFHAVNQRQAKFMVTLTEGAYTTKDLFDMERAVFKANNYDIKTIDISTYVHYYILLLNVADANIISECSHYLLNCSYLNSVFVFIQPSKLAAASVFTSLHLMNQYSDELWMKLSAHIGYYSPGKLILLKENLIDVVKQVNDPSFPCREPYFKYSSSKHYRISLIVLENLIQEELLS